MSSIPFCLKWTWFCGLKLNALGDSGFLKKSDKKRSGQLQNLSWRLCNENDDYWVRLKSLWECFYSNKCCLPVIRIVLCFCTKLCCRSHPWLDTERSCYWSAAQPAVLRRLYVPQQIIYKLCLITYRSTEWPHPTLYFRLLHWSSENRYLVVLIEISTASPVVFHEVWQMFLLCCWIHCMEQSSWPCEICTISGDIRVVTQNLFSLQYMAFRFFNSCAMPFFSPGHATDYINCHYHYWY